MDILFVHPNASRDIYQDLSTNYSAIEPPIWAALLAGGLRAKGVSVDVLDTEALQLTPEQTVESINACDPKLVCFVVYGQQPSASTQNMQGVKYVCDLIAQEGRPSYKTILVGLYPSACSRKCMAEEKVDFVCQGEGLYTLESLLQANMDDVAELKKVPGLWYRDSGNICSTKPALPVPQNSLEYEFPEMTWDLLPMEKYRTATWHSMTNGNNKEPFAALYTSLGCPFQCTFCCINAPFGNNNLDNPYGSPSFRYWDPDYIIKQFDEIADMGIRNVKLADEMFVLNKNHFLKLCKLIEERGYDFNIWAYARIDTVKEKYLDLLKRAGVNWLGLGIESGNRLVRKDVIKGKFEEVDITDVCKKIEGAGIEVAANYIFGLPEDTKDSMNDTLNLALEINASMANFYSAMAYPGSQLYLDANLAGLVLPDTYSGYSQHSYDCTPLNTKFIDNKEVLSFRDQAFDIYHTNDAWLDKIRSKFGDDTVSIYRDIVSHKLKRKLLGD